MYNVLQGGIFLLLSVGAVSFYITYVCTGSPWFIYGTLSLLLLMAMYAGHYRVRMRRRFNIIVSFIFITTLLHSCSTLTLFSFNRPVTWFIGIPLSCTTFIPSMEICFQINLFWLVELCELLIGKSFFCIMDAFTVVAAKSDQVLG